MFDFEKLEVYQEVRDINVAVFRLLLENPTIDLFLQEQLKRASMSSMLNLAEGTGRMTSPDKRRFYTMARASVFESVAILQVLMDVGFITEASFKTFYGTYEKISKMLLGMIRSQE